MICHFKICAKPETRFYKNFDTLSISIKCSEQTRMQKDVKWLVQFHQKPVPHNACLTFRTLIIHTYSEAKSFLLYLSESLSCFRRTIGHRKISIWLGRLAVLETKAS